MQTSVQKWGNSLGLRIPSVYAKELHLLDGSIVDIQRKENEIIISPAKKKKSLNDLIQLITNENQHGEIDFGSPHGKEEW
jgi:antitoxin MazE